ncbi:hypothetical protein MSS2_03465 [Mycobacterium marinum]|uniref:PIN-like domain-containing protein n=1 Tax=Mycobacterium marinum TaxID=1781 RepID=UPI000E3C55E7|nr:hypothetical protein [Mycobacterium marinum]RFZ51504.1 hypothetical protein MSS2_03465 [Mycobacterium marinum]
MTVKDAEVRFYFDADILGLAHVVCSLRPDCTYPGDKGKKIKRHIRGECVIREPKTADREWIPIVATRGWVAITRDGDIQNHLSLLQLVKEYQLRLVTLTGADAGTPWRQLGILIPQWRNIESLVDREGPVVIAATRTGFRNVDIDKAIEKIREGRKARRPRRRHRVGEGLFSFSPELR